MLTSSPPPLLPPLLSKVSLLGELFPFAEPVSLVEKAPMLLALGENTLRVKTDTWRHVLEPRLDVSWEEVHVFYRFFVSFRFPIKRG